MRGVGSLVRGRNTQAYQRAAYFDNGFIGLKNALLAGKGYFAGPAAIGADPSVIPIKSLNDRRQFIGDGETCQKWIDIPAGMGIPDFKMEMRGLGGACITAIGNQHPFLNGEAAGREIQFLLPAFGGVLPLLHEGGKFRKKPVQMTIHGGAAVGMGDEECVTQSVLSDADMTDISVGGCKDGEVFLAPGADVESHMKMIFSKLAEIGRQLQGYIERLAEIGRGVGRLIIKSPQEGQQGGCQET